MSETPTLLNPIPTENLISIAAIVIVVAIIVVTIIFAILHSRSRCTQ